MDEYIDQRSTGAAGETGTATGDGGGDLIDVIVGEIPDPADLTRMLWTARCTAPTHGLLGTFENRELAEQARLRHLVSEHR